LNNVFAHITTSKPNAVVCEGCHRNRANLPPEAEFLLPPFAPAPPGTPPACFNNTLCHSFDTPNQHLAGWTIDHAPAARFLTTLTQIRLSCGTSGIFCHGSDLSGSGSAGPSCFSCHLGSPDNRTGIMHPDNWPTPTVLHPPHLRNLGNSAVSCSPVSARGVNVAQYCHGQNLLETSPRIAPPNGSWVQGPSCFTCHGKLWIAP
jgi:hypothetical protein